MTAISKTLAVALSLLLLTQQATASLMLDRTRVIVPSNAKSVSVSVDNKDPKRPFLAQAWVENEAGEKITSPLVVLPPVQRVDANKSTLIRIQPLPAAQKLPQDRESLFYFNLREIPPKSKEPNMLQIALQTRVKLFYRPASLIANEGKKPWQEELTLTKTGDKYQVNNPTPYYITISELKAGIDGTAIDGFNSLMLAPKSQATLDIPASRLGATPVLSYVNDFGGKLQLLFKCSGNDCSVAESRR